MRFFDISTRSYEKCTEVEILLLKRKRIIHKAFNKLGAFKKILLDEPGEIIFKSFSDILSLISGAYYPPRSKKITSLIYRLKKKNFIKSTLGGCVIEEKDNFIFITRESRGKKKLTTAHKVRVFP